MTLNFTNPSRSHQSDHHGVRFWGYDRSFEVQFLVTEAALHALQPGAADATGGYLAAFDSHLDRIREVAAQVYARSRRLSYALSPADF